ncbi:sulfatase family protein [Thermoflexibacter ruber]|nr:sulfatase [Thermoflexibacter ruber]
MKFISIVLLLFLFLSFAERQKDTFPNVIIIFADDLAYADIACFGANYPTPYLDKLAKEGMKFTDFYSQPQCSPSRAALLTGCYPQRVGIPWVVGPEGPAWTKDKYFVGLHPDEETLPELLKTKSYATACIGKWHLGHHSPHLPTKHGFDEFFGLPYSNDMYPLTPDGMWSDLPLIEGEKEIEKNPDQSLLTKRYTEKALNFIESNKQKPFFLYLAHSMPHVPIFASKKFEGKSKKGLYADVIQEIDWSVGEIIKALKKHKLDDNTLIIFTSDNGAWLTYGNHAGSSGIFREGKGTTFEGGVRVPMIAWWKGKIPAGSTCNKVVGLIDILPTLAQITGAKLPNKAIDGKNFLPLLENNPQAKSPRDFHYFFQIHELQAIRQGKWKLHLPHTYESVEKAGNDGQRGKTIQKQIELSLYDLEKDPSEQENLAKKYPEIVEKLKKEALRFQEDLEKNKRPAGNSL